MGRLGWVLAALLLACGSAQAQLRIDQLPLRLTAGAEVQVTAEGNRVLLAATIRTTLSGVQESIDALIPTLNQRFSCEGGNQKLGLTIADATLSPGPASSIRSQVVLTMSVTGRECFTQLLHTNATVTVPLSVGARRSAVIIVAGSPEVTPTGFFVRAFLSDAMRQDINRKVSQFLHQRLRTVNKLVNAASLGAIASGQFKMFNPRVQSIEIVARGGDLTIETQLAGQIAGRTVNAWLTRL
jgi:hypothetical protein